MSPISRFPRRAIQDIAHIEWFWQQFWDRTIEHLLHRLLYALFAAYTAAFIYPLVIWLRVHIQHVIATRNRANRARLTPVIRKSLILIHITLVEDFMQVALGRRPERAWRRFNFHLSSNASFLADVLFPRRTAFIEEEAIEGHNIGALGLSQTFTHNRSPPSTMTDPFAGDESIQATGQRLHAAALAAAAEQAAEPLMNSSAPEVGMPAGTLFATELILGGITSALPAADAIHNVGRDEALPSEPPRLRRRTIELPDVGSSEPSNNRTLEDMVVDHGRTLLHFVSGAEVFDDPAATNPYHI